MKKKRKKLALKRSTIRQLTSAKLRLQQGAACGSAATCDAATCHSCNCTMEGQTCYSCYVLWCYSEGCGGGGGGGNTNDWWCWF